jgi:hypothetical protein
MDISAYQSFKYLHIMSRTHLNLMDSSEPHELTHYQAGENPLASGELRSARKAKHTVRHTVTNTKKAVAHTKKVQRRAGAVRSTSQRQKVRDMSLRMHSSLFITFVVSFCAKTCDMESQRGTAPKGA